MRHGPRHPHPLYVHLPRSLSLPAHAKTRLRSKTARSKTAGVPRPQTARQTTKCQQPRNRQQKSQQKSQQRMWLMKNRMCHPRRPHCPLGSQLRQSLRPCHLLPKETALSRQGSVHCLRRAMVSLTGQNCPIGQKYHILAEGPTWIGLGSLVTIEEMHPAIQETTENLATDEKGGKLGIREMGGRFVIPASLTHATTVSHPVRGKAETTEQEILGLRDQGTSPHRTDALESQIRGTWDDLTGSGPTVANHRRHGGMTMHPALTERTASLGTGPLTDPAGTTLAHRESMPCRPRRQLLRRKTMLQSLRLTLTACAVLMRATGLILSTQPVSRLLRIRVSRLAQTRVHGTNPVSGPLERTRHDVLSTSNPILHRRKIPGTTVIHVTVIQITMVLAGMDMETRLHRNPDLNGNQREAQASGMLRMLAAAGSQTRTGLFNRILITADSTISPRSGILHREHRRVRVAVVVTRLESAQPTVLR